MPSENAAPGGTDLAYAIGSFAPARRPAHHPVEEDHVDWGGRSLVIREVATDPVAEGEAVFLTVEPRHCVLLED